MKTKDLTINIIWKHFYTFLFLSLSISYCQDMTSDPSSNIYSCIENGNELSLNNRNCFNNILVFDQKNYQVNSFAKNKNGDILIQFSEHTNYSESSSSRLFYGLTKDGRYFFSNKSSYSNEVNVDIDEETFYDNEFYYLDAIRNSKSLFVSIRNTPNKENQYLFSINSYNSMVELYDLNNDNNNYYIWSFNKFFNLDPDDYFFPFDYELFEIKERSEYIIVFIPKMIVYDEILDVSFMKKFRFQSFDINAYEERVLVTYEDYLDSKIMNVFYMDDFNTLVVLYINENIIDPSTQGGDSFTPPIDRKLLRLSQYESNIGPFPSQVYYKFNLKFYNSNLKSLSYIKDVTLYNGVSQSYKGENLFIKSLYINIMDEPFVIFIYSAIDFNWFLFELFYIDLDFLNEQKK